MFARLNCVCASVFGDTSRKLVQRVAARAAAARPLRHASDSANSGDNNDDGDKFSRASHAKSTVKGLRPSTSSKYVPVTDDNTQTILDFHEEKYGKDAATIEDDEVNNYYLYRDKRRTRTPSSAEQQIARGDKSVFTVENLTAILRLEGMKDLATIRIDPELMYCDHMILATGVSARHLDAVCEYIIKLNKAWKRSDEPFLSVIGNEQSTDWKVIDMGRIVLHLMLRETRDKFDIESLWCVGEEHDEKTQRPDYDVVVTMMDKHLKFIQELQAQPDANAATSKETGVTN